MREIHTNTSTSDKKLSAIALELSHLTETEDFPNATSPIRDFPTQSNNELMCVPNDTNARKHLLVINIILNLHDRRQ